MTWKIRAPKSSHFHPLITFNHFKYPTKLSDKNDNHTPEETLNNSKPLNEAEICAVSCKIGSWVSQIVPF